MRQESGRCTGTTRRDILRRIAAAGLLAVPVGELVACSSGGTGRSAGADPFGVRPDVPLEVIIFLGGYGDDYAKVHESMYQKQFPKAAVKHVTTKEVQGLVQPRLDAGNPPDVVLNDGPKQFNLGSLVNDGLLVDLTELVDAPTLDDPTVKIRDTLLPGTLESGTFNGKLYVLNYAYTLFGLYYDAALFKDKGWQPPKTWDDFRTLAPQIKAAGIGPWAYAGKYPYYMGWPLADWIQKIGGVDTAKNIDNLEPNAWRQPAVATAVGMVIEMVANGWLLPGTQDINHTMSQQALIDGKAALLPCGTWLENEMKATMRPGVELTFLPVWSAGGSDAMPAGAVRAGAAGAFIIPTKAANKAGALEYLRIMMSKQGAATFAKFTHSLASAKGSAATVTGSTALSSASAALDAAGSNIIQWRFNDWYADLDKEWQAAVDDLMRGNIKQPAQFADRLQAAADQVAKDPSITKFVRQ